MSVVKILEILAESPKSWEDATQMAVTEAAKTVDNIQNVYIAEMKAIVEGKKIVRYRVNTKISFIVKD
ncbi:MAG: dodecin family protein [Dethiosulfatibacter sp.]|nr:dodecin family protein [Dethiosulfatibacter sp.]